MQRYGRNGSGRQRWRCRECGRTFSWKNIGSKHARHFVWFRRWVTEGYTLRQVAWLSGYSFSTVRRIIGYWLSHPPARPPDFSSCRYLIIDGTSFGRRKGILGVMEAGSHRLMVGLQGVSEGPLGSRGLCAHLKRQKAAPKSATVDGNPHMIKALRQQWPKVIVQRCLVHIQRQGLAWCRRRPTRTDAQHLRKLFEQIGSLRTRKEKKRFLQQVQEWEKRYGCRIAACPETGWVFSDLKRARSLLLSALPDMFHYLQDPRIPKSTNALEGYFSRLKRKYRQHSGLATHHRPAYFQWYLYLRPR